MQASLRTQSASRRVEADYVTPAGEQRILEITISPVYTPSGETLGAACLITDKTEFALIQRLQELRGEMSAEMALALRNSLATISSYAQQLAVSRDPRWCGSWPSISCRKQPTWITPLAVSSRAQKPRRLPELEFNQRRRACEDNRPRHGG